VQKIEQKENVVNHQKNGADESERRIGKISRNQLQARAIDQAGHPLMPGGEAMTNLAGCASLEGWANRNDHRERQGHYDDGTDAGKANSFAKRLIDDDKVDVIVGGTTTGSTMSMVPLVEKAEIPFISLAGAVVPMELCQRCRSARTTRCREDAAGRRSRRTHRLRPSPATSTCRSA
jgi:hypothetical protein